MFHEVRMAILPPHRIVTVLKVSSRLPNGQNKVPSETWPPGNLSCLR